MGALWDRGVADADGDYDIRFPHPEPSISGDNRPTVNITALMTEQIFQTKDYVIMKYHKVSWIADCLFQKYHQRHHVYFSTKDKVVKVFLREMC